MMIQWNVLLVLMTRNKQANHAEKEILAQNEETKED